MGIVIWDEDVHRIQRMESAVGRVLGRLNVKMAVSSNCEPPLLARHNLYGKTPALQIGQDFWSKTPGRDLTDAELEGLLRYVLGLM